MRDTRLWRKDLTEEIRKNWPKGLLLSRGYSGELCDVELALTSLSRLNNTKGGANLPEQGEFFWALLQGYDFGFPEELALEIATVRHLLLHFRSRQTWKNALERYEEVPDFLRGFDVDSCGVWHRKSVSIASNRFALYEKTLRRGAPHRQGKTRWAQSGDYRFQLGEFESSVHIPEELCFPTPKPYAFEARTTTLPISIQWTDLLQTAQDMDAIEQSNNVPVGESKGHWFARLDRVELHLRDAEGIDLSKAEVLNIEGLLHLVGMVSSGKSTLMEVLAFHCARQGHRVTLVLADVIDVLRRAALFSRLGISAAPILGATGRESHLNRLHRFVAAQKPDAGLEASHDGFRWLSTVCALDGLRQSGRGALPLGNRPCTQLIPANLEDDSNPRTCPIFAKCDFHRATLDLRDAKIWLATPASLVYTRVAAQLAPQRVRFTEMVYRNSDLVIIDEADRVQMLLDAAFSPSEVLINKGDSAWMTRLEQRVMRRIHTDRSLLAQPEIDDWCQSHGNMQNAAERLYGRLQREKDVRGWLTKRNYFTAQMLFHQIALACSGANEKGDGGDDDIYKALDTAFKQCMDAPLGGDDDLSELARMVAFDNNFPPSKTQKWIESQLTALDVLEDRKLPAKKLDLWGSRLQTALLVTILQNQLAYILRFWRDVEAPLQLEDGGQMLFHRPPEDFKPVLPLPPMGRELAFQYLPPDDKESGPGDLRFFRCESVGRALMLNFHQLWLGEGVAGPHVLLLSGTSWAGTSPSCHVQAPVDGVLKAPPEEIEAIEKSQFRFLPIRTENADAKPIFVSGKQGHERNLALRSILHHLAVRPESNNPSILEKQRDDLPGGRQRILLLTGSYAEAQLVYDWFVNSSPNRDQWSKSVRVLVPDTADLEAGFDAGQLPRGLVHKFSEGDEWILIAPLLAVERGHNIINENGHAAIGAAYFLVRPHPRPDDISYAIHSINRWAMNSDNIKHRATVGEAAESFRKRGRQRWNQLIRTRLQWKLLSDSDEGGFNEREAVTWTQMVAIWQVIGRLVRGGQPARIFFCDAAFAPNSAANIDAGDTVQTSLLVSMRHVLQPYFSSKSGKNLFEKKLVQTLYGPLYQALDEKNMYGLAEKKVQTGYEHSIEEQEESLEFLDSDEEEL